MKHQSRRRALSLIIVLAVMSLIAGVVVGLTHHSATLHAQLRSQRLQAMARYSTESAKQLIRIHERTLSTSPTNEPLELDLDSLLTGSMMGSGVIECTTINGATSCEVDVQLRLSRKRLRQRTTVEFR